MKEEVKIKKLKQIRVRTDESLISQLKKEAKGHKMSLSSYVDYLLNTLIRKGEPIYQETINKLEKKEVESRVYFTKSEAELLKRYAELNGWSMSKEIRYRIVSSLSKTPKLNKEELKAIYSVRSSINVLGANINRLIRNDQVISDHNIAFCTELSDLIRKLQLRINWLIKCGNTNFKIKDK